MPLPRLRGQTFAERRQALVDAPPGLPPEVAWLGPVIIVLTVWWFVIWLGFALSWAPLVAISRGPVQASSDAAMVGIMFIWGVLVTWCVRVAYTNEQIELPSDSQLTYLGTPLPALLARDPDALFNVVPFCNDCQRKYGMLCVCLCVCACVRACVFV